MCVKTLPVFLSQSVCSHTDSSSRTFLLTFVALFFLFHLLSLLLLLLHPLLLDFVRPFEFLRGRRNGDISCKRDTRPRPAPTRARRSAPTISAPTKIRPPRTSSVPGRPPNVSSRIPKAGRIRSTSSLSCRSSLSRRLLQLRSEGGRRRQPPCRWSQVDPWHRCPKPPTQQAPILVFPH